MSTHTVLFLVLLATAVGMVAGYIVGRDAGRSEGRDAQWVDDYFERVRKDRERRDSAGRFRAKGHA